MKGGKNLSYMILLSITSNIPGNSILNKLKVRKGSLGNTSVKGITEIQTAKNKSMDHPVQVLTR